MRLPVMPPVKPMLAKSVAEIPNGDLSFEPDLAEILGSQGPNGGFDGDDEAA